MDLDEEDLSYQLPSLKDVLNQCQWLSERYYLREQGRVVQQAVGRILEQMG